MNRIELVLVLLFTFFVIVVWVTSDVILVRPNTPDDPKIQTMLEPLTPSFDQETMQKISTRDITTPIRPTPRPTTGAIPATQPVVTNSQNSPEPLPTPSPSINPLEAADEINNLTTPNDEGITPQAEASPTPSTVEPTPIP